MKKWLMVVAALITMAFGVFSWSSVHGMTKGEFEKACGESGGYVVEKLDKNGNVINTYCHRPGGQTGQCEHRSTNVGPNTVCWFVGPADKPQRSRQPGIREQRGIQPGMNPGIR